MNTHKSVQHFKIHWKSPFILLSELKIHICRTWRIIQGNSWWEGEWNYCKTVFEYWWEMFNSCICDLSSVIQSLVFLNKVLEKSEEQEKVLLIFLSMVPSDTSDWITYQRYTTQGLWKDSKSDFKDIWLNFHTAVIFWIGSLRSYGLIELLANEFNHLLHIYSIFYISLIPVKIPNNCCLKSALTQSVCP